MPANITDELLSLHYDPAAMLVVYKNREGCTYLETHLIGEDGMPGAAVPVTRKFLSDLLQHFSAVVSKSPHGVMPANMLLADSRPGQEHYIWWEGPRMRMQHFREDLGLVDAEYPVPGVIYEVRESRLNIYAFEGRRPKKDSALLEGPFFNVTRGSVCLGSAKVAMPSDLTWEALQEYWQKLFWGSVNSHLGSNPLKENAADPAKSNLVLVLKDCLGKDTFDTNLLKPIRGLTLSKLLKKERP